MNVILHAAVVTDLGSVRKNNEDSAHAGQRLLAVADGIGGMPSGELASEIVIRTLARLDQVELDPLTATDPVAALCGALAVANDEVRDVAESNPSHDGMGTTVTALLHVGDQMILLHVGDSRGYLLRDGTLTQITRDDTFIQALIDDGAITAEDARHHPMRSVVTQAIQGRDFTPTVATLPLRPADRFMLCSDGLSDVVPNDMIALTLRTEPDPKHSAEQLVALALAGGGPDNVTVIVADVAVEDDH